MKINNGNDQKAGGMAPQEALKSRQSVGAKRDAGQPRTERPDAGEKVTISLAESKLQEIVQKVRSETDVDQEKVKAIRLALANGDYQTDPEAIARRILLEDSLLANL